jgi:dTMP kinase
MKRPAGRREGATSRRTQRYALGMEMSAAPPNESVTTGVLLAVEGCSGVGKTTLVAELKVALEGAATPLSVKLPSDGALGKLARELLEQQAFEAVALTAAADRALVAQNTVLPALHVGGVVIADRWALSSLALNALSGLPYDFSYALSSRLPQPNLSILLLADAKVTEARLRDREDRDLYEREAMISASPEQSRLVESARFLARKGWRIAEFDVGSLTPTDVAKRIATMLKAQGLLGNCQT